MVFPGGGITCWCLKVPKSFKVSVLKNSQGYSRRAIFFDHLHNDNPAPARFYRRGKPLASRIPPSPSFSIQTLRRSTRRVLRAQLSHTPTSLSFRASAPPSPVSLRFWSSIVRDSWDLAPSSCISKSCRALTLNAI